MDNIIIFDNFLNDNEIIEMMEIIIKKKWKYGHSSGYREIINNNFFSVYNYEFFFL